MDAKKLFADMPRAKVNVTIDLNAILSEKEFNVVGLDYNAFESFELDTLTISGTGRTFYLLQDSLKDTNLQTLKHSRYISLDGIYTATNANFVEVNS
jgi:hypothetical protein